jgi:hypothetical protein
MKNIMRFSILSLLFFIAQSVQAQVFEKGVKIANLGIQLQSGITPIAISGEYGLTDDIGVGAKIAYGSKSSVSSFFIGGMANFHLAKIMNLGIDKLDIYAGPTAGLTRAKVTVLTVSSAGTNVTIQGQAGARYLVTDSIGAYGQVNLGLYNTSGSNLEVGLSLKLK